MDAIAAIAAAVAQTAVKVGLAAVSSGADVNGDTSFPVAIQFDTPEEDMQMGSGDEAFPEEEEEEEDASFP